MSVTHGKTFTSDRAWGAVEIAVMRGVSTRLHWTDQPYHWHVNSGEEVFVVLDGVVEMRYRIDASEQRVLLGPGDIFHACAGLAHVAHPLGAARILVVEEADSE